MKPKTFVAEKSWHIANRWQEFEGEMRAAVLRSLLVAVFYSIQLTHFIALSSVDEKDRIYHREITLVSIAWLFLSLAIFIALKGGFMPRYLKYVVTLVDLILITLLAWLGHGPASPLVNILFVVLALAAIRFRIGLVWFATIGAMIAYMTLVASADKTWFSQEHSTPLLTQAITLGALASTGVLLGQMIRATRSFVDTLVRSQAVDSPEEAI